jgi:integrase
MRHQDPKIERAGRRRQYYQIRPYLRVVRQDGRVEIVRRRIRLGYCDEITLREARKRKAEIMVTINGGQVTVASQLTLAAVIERFRAAHMPTLASTTRAKYEAHIRNHILPDLGHLRVGEIDRSIIAEWLLAKGTLSKATRLDLRNLLAAIFRCATEWRMWAGDNPAHRAPVGRGGAQAREFARPTDEQIIRWLEEIHDTAIMPAWQARQLAELCLVAGLRVSEALGLRWRDVDTARRTVRIERRYARGDVDAPKSAASRRERYVGPLADEILFRRPEGMDDDAPIFARPDGRIPDDRDLQQHVWRPAAERAGIYHPGFGLHSLRRLSITWRQECGATLLEAMRQAGHSRPAMTAQYTLDDLRREMQVVDRLRERMRASTAVSNGTKRDAI